MAKKWFHSYVYGHGIIGASDTVNSQAQNDSTDETGNTDLIQAPSGVLMEPETGTIIYEKDKDTRRSPASITKIMTLILIFDALEKGTLKLEDTVTTSAYAKSNGWLSGLSGGRGNSDSRNHDQMYCDSIRQ